MRGEPLTQAFGPPYWSADLQPGLCYFAPLGLNLPDTIGPPAFGRSWRAGTGPVLKLCGCSGGISSGAHRGFAGPRVGASPEIAPLECSLCCTM